ncbi:MAG TPA: hypothetical protein EYP56_02585 [Planctomycetaceae bacterium]|nr:hypothetical protein [Planctomycetaceae bacterium]
MIRRLDQRRLQRLCRQRRTAYHVSDVALRLGGLARWWLRDDVLALAAAEEPWRSEETEWLTSKPDLPDSPGCCWVLFALEHTEQWPLLRPAFLLPLCWKSNVDHSPQLPPALRQLADEVLTELCPPGRGADPRWGLHLAECDEINEWDLSDLQFRCDSGKAPLAAGLICAMEGVRPDHRVWATGTWGGGRDTATVGRLAEKLQLAHQWGVDEFFVPAGMVQTAQKWCKDWGAAIVIGTLDLAVTGGAEANAETVRKALKDYLSSLDVAPPVDVKHGVSPGVRAWYIRQTQRDRERALSFYWQKLLPVISHLCRRRIEEAAGRRGLSPGLRFSHLVTIASDSPEVVPLVAKALDVSQCLVLYTADKTKMMESARTGLAGSRCSVRVRQFDQEANLRAQFDEAVSKFTEGVPPENVVFDLTPGNKLMSLTLEHQVARRGNWLHYLRHEIERRTVCPGSERPILWRAGESWDEGIVT